MFASNWFKCVLGWRQLSSLVLLSFFGCFRFLIGCFGFLYCFMRILGCCLCPSPRLEPWLLLVLVDCRHRQCRGRRPFMVVNILWIKDWTSWTEDGPLDIKNSFDINKKNILYPSLRLHYIRDLTWPVPPIVVLALLETFSNVKTSSQYVPQGWVVRLGHLLLESVYSPTFDEYDF